MMGMIWFLWTWLKCTVIIVVACTTIAIALSMFAISTEVGALACALLLGLIAAILTREP